MSTEDALKAKELEIAELKARLDAHGARSETRMKLPLALISLVSAVVGAVASLGVAYVGGSFSIQEKAEDRRTAISLEQAKFSYQLITTALSEEDEQTRAQSLRFLLDIGLLDSLNKDKVLEYAADDQEFPTTDTGVGSKTPPRISTLTEIQTRPDPSDLPPLLSGFAVIIEDSGPTKINVIKVVRQVTGVGLKDAKFLVETEGAPLSSGMTEAAANRFANELRENGASVRVIRVSDS